LNHGAVWALCNAIPFLLRIPWIALVDTLLGRYLRWLLLSVLIIGLLHRILLLHLRLHLLLHLWLHLLLALRLHLLCLHLRLIRRLLSLGKLPLLLLIDCGLIRLLHPGILVLWILIVLSVYVLANLVLWAHTLRVCL